MTAQTVPGPRPSAMLAARYARALDIAVVVAAAGWHLAGAGPLLLAHLGSYSSDQFQVAAWCAITLIIAAGSVLLLRGSARRGTGWALAAAALVISTAAAAACPPAQMLETNWAWGTAGWVGVLVLLRRPLAELGVFLTLEALAMFAVLARDGLHQPNVAAFITVLAGSTGIQVAISVAARTLHVPAQQAADAATREADATARQAVADRIRGARQARWLELRATAEPLLSGLAAGTADPRISRSSGPARSRRRGCGGCSPRRTTHRTRSSTNCMPAPTSRSGAGWRWTSRPQPSPAQSPDGAPRGAARGAPGHHGPGHRGPCQRNLPGARHCYRDGRWRDRQPGLRLARRAGPARQPGRAGGGQSAGPAEPVGGGALEHHVTVAIVDDHPVVVEGVMSWIRADPEQRITVTQVVSDITGLAGPRAADVLILDLELGGRMIADEVARLAASGYRIVAFSAHVDPALILDVLDAGAHAYVSKDEGRDHLLEAVLAAAADRPCVTRSQAKAILADPRPGRPALSGKERQALLLWFQGMSKASVAAPDVHLREHRPAVHRPGPGEVRHARPGRTPRTRCWPGPSRTASSGRARWRRTPPSPARPVPRSPDGRAVRTDGRRPARRAGAPASADSWPAGAAAGAWRPGSWGPGTWPR